MERMTYREAVTTALGAELESDPDVFLLGEDIAAAGGVFKATDGLLERFGASRIRDTPISEQGIIGAAIGSAVMGMRPVAEIMFADFAAVCFDQLANQLPKYQFMTGGQVSLPVTVRLANGAGGGFGAQHSQPCENWFLNFPGLKIVVPATPGDAYRLLRAAIRDPGPVLFFEHKSLYNLQGDVDVSADEGKLGTAEVARTGSDVTVVATQLMRHRTLEAADALNADGIDVEVIDPRSLVPFDSETVLESVGKTNRLLVVQESSQSGSWGSDLLARVAIDGFELLDTPPRLCGAPATPIPYAGSLEEAWLPSVDRIAQAVRTLLDEG